MFKKGELVLIPVPFSDLSAQKRRPVVIISNDAYNQKTSDILVAAVTSNIRKRAYTIALNQEDMKSGTLPKPSCIRADKLYNLSSSLVVKSVGQISDNSLGSLIDQVSELIRRD